MTVQELQPYLVAGSSLLSIAILGLMLNIFRSMRMNSRDQIDFHKDRVQAEKDDKDKVKEWAEREKSDLQKKNDELQAILLSEGIDAEALAAGKQLDDSTHELRNTVERLTAEMEQQISALRQIDSSSSLSKSGNEATRTIAMANMASGDYADAAASYDRVSARGMASWEDHVSRGIAHANARRDPQSDLSALMAYNDALAVAPDSIDPNKRARIFTYRAAMLKRLERYREALNDLSISLELATNDYEILDANYNFACVYALMGRAEEMHKSLKIIEHSKRFRSGVAAHLHDYFKDHMSNPIVQSIASER